MKLFLFHELEQSKNFVVQASPIGGNAPLLFMVQSPARGAATLFFGRVVS